MNPVTKNYIGTGLVAISVFVLYAFGWNYFSNIQTYNTAITGANATLVEKQSILEKIGILNEQYKTRRSSIDRISSLIPTKKNTAELISSIEKISSDSGIRVSRLLISDTKSIAANDYNELRIELFTAGNYQSLISMLSTFERNIRLLDVNEISVTRDLQNPLLLNFTVVTSAYYLKDNATNI